jgi:hypothetical protein
MSAVQGNSVVPSASSSRTREFLRNFGLVAGSVAAVLMALEVVFRFVSPLPTPYGLPVGLMSNRDGVWLLTPGLKAVMDNGVDFVGKILTVDEESRRVTPASAAVPTPRRQVHLFGDSQTFGQGLSDVETWPNLVQQQLLAGGIADTVVRNLGVPGINIDQYAARLDRIAPTIQSGDLVVVGMSWNDLMAPGGEHEAMQVINGYLVRRRDDPHKVHEIEWRLRVFETTKLIIPTTENMKAFVIGLSANSALATFLLPHARALYYRLRPTANPYQHFIDLDMPRKNFWFLHAMRDKTEALGARFVVVFLPDRLFFDDAAYRLYSRDGAVIAPQNYMAALALPLCREFRFQCIDTFDVLHRHHKERLSFRHDGHFTPRAAALIADELAGPLTALLGSTAPRP